VLRKKNRSFFANKLHKYFAFVLADLFAKKLFQFEFIFLHPLNKFFNYVKLALVFQWIHYREISIEVLEFIGKCRYKISVLRPRHETQRDECKHAERHSAEFRENVTVPKRHSTECNNVTTRHSPDFKNCRNDILSML
jgi:hypothetical protein